MSAGELTAGYHVNLHLWLTAQASENGTIRLQGFGLYEPLDYVLYNPLHGQMMMPPVAIDELKESGKLFLEVSSDEAQIPFNVTTGFAPTIPFYLENCLRASQVIIHRSRVSRPRYASERMWSINVGS